MIEPNPQKFCSKCQETLPVAMFCKNKSVKSGLSSRCRQCLRQDRLLFELLNPERYKEIILGRTERTRQRRLIDPVYRRANRLWNRAKSRSKIPPWAGFSDFYPVCAKVIAAGPGYEIDHIIPLKGKLVSGLHVPSNVRVVLIAVNQKKSNHYPVI